MTASISLFLMLSSEETGVSSLYRREINRFQAKLQNYTNDDSSLTYFMVI